MAPPEQQTESQRIQLMVTRDPATRINIRDYLESKMMQCKKFIGDEMYEAVLKSVDSEIIEQYQQHGKGSSLPPK